MMTCKTCKHPNKTQINRAIANGESLRNISKRFEVSPAALFRHTEKCLSLTLSAFIEKNREKQAIDVHKEFEDNLNFARKLRLAAEEYLSDAQDPLKLAIIPRADEIDIVYFESWATITDEDSENGDEKPRVTKLAKPEKKTAKLSVLLQHVEQMRNIKVDKFSIKHYDLRKFALDAINTADSCVDRFAKLGGEYQRDRENQQTTDKLQEVVKQLIENGTVENPEQAAVLLRNSGFQVTTQEIEGLM